MILKFSFFSLRAQFFASTVDPSKAFETLDSRRLEIRKQTERCLSSLIPIAKDDLRHTDATKLRHSAGIQLCQTDNVQLSRTDDTKLRHTDDDILRHTDDDILRPSDDSKARHTNNIQLRHSDDTKSRHSDNVQLRHTENTKSRHSVGGVVLSHCDDSDGTSSSSKSSSSTIVIKPTSHFTRTLSATTPTPSEPPSSSPPPLEPLPVVLRIVPIQLSSKKLRRNFSVDSLEDEDQGIALKGEGVFAPPATSDVFVVEPSFEDFEGEKVRGEDKMSLWDSRAAQVKGNNNLAR